MRPDAGAAMSETEGDGADGAPGNCLNCGAALAGRFCQQCGQRAHVHRTLGAFWHDLLHGVLHFEGRTWRTLPLLAWRPGELTRRYIAGERAKFVSPMALFLFSVFLMFAVFSWVGGPLGPVAPSGPSAEEAAASRAQAEQRLRALEGERVARLGRREDVRVIDAQIAAIRGTLEEVRLAEGRTDDGLKLSFGARETGIAWLDRAIHKAEENPSLLIYKLQSNAYKFSWLLIPISVPFLWLLFFWKRRYGAYDHVVFVTYSLSFLTLMLVLLALLQPLFRIGGEAILALFVLQPVHMYRQLRGAYALRWFGALWRTILLLLFAFVALGLFTLVLLALGLLG
ncbi:MAG TPA: DUF3667 domain-containing protein [Allosphingosinicella sp.]|nr:DUF3667 domain-containing protein [Allosphingosinicella sp.]